MTATAAEIASSATTTLAGISGAPRPPEAMAPLRNVLLFDELLDRVVSRRPHLPGLGTFHGFSGLGKSVAARFGAARHRALYLEVGESWTRAKFCRALLTALGEAPHGTVGEMVDRIVARLAALGRPLIIDEFDHVVARRYVETIREIHDKSGAPILLIGEEMLPTKLLPWERFHNRILDWVPAQPTTAEDVRALAALHAPGLALAADLLAHVNARSDGRVRRVVVNLERLREAALLDGVERLDRAGWGDRPLFSGLPPRARRAG